MGIATSIFVSTHLTSGIDVDLPEDANQSGGKSINKEKLLSNGDKWEPEIAAAARADAPYR
jgi:hypothetical protein